MGLFKQMKDMKDLVHAAPDMVEQAQQMGANAQAMQAQMIAQQQAAMAQAAAAQQAPGAAAPGSLDAIAGVDIELYARIVKAIAPLNYDQSALPRIAASHGIDGASWQQAHDGWNARIQGQPAVAKAFSDAYARV